MRLDHYGSFPSGMLKYLEFYGWHFSKKMEEWAAKKMYREGKLRILPYSLLDVEDLLSRNSIVLDHPVCYDTVYVTNMAKADYYGSSIEDDLHLARFVKDTCQDPDGYEGMVFTRFYADCIGSGCPIDWEDML